MGNEVLNKLDTSKVASGFNEFLGAQGLGNMNPSTARKYREGVESSPMDDILAVNGFDFDEVFKKIPPEPPPLAELDEVYQETNWDESKDGESPARSAVNSLGLSNKAQETLQSLLESGGSTQVGELPAEMLQLLQSPGISTAADLILQLGELHTIIGDKRLPGNRDLTELMLAWMKDLSLNNSRTLLDYLNENPTRIKEALRDPLTGITGPLIHTSTLLQVKNAFSDDPIIGSSKDDTLLGSRAGAARLLGNGGADLFVIPLSNKPFPLTTFIADFDPLTGSKIVLELSEQNMLRVVGFKAAKNSAALSRLSRTKTSLILDIENSRLLYNGNRKKKGLGLDKGGIIAAFENGISFGEEDLLILRGDYAFTIDEFQAT